LNRNGRATVFSEIPKLEHDRLLSSAAIYALCLNEDAKSSGQIRLASGIEAGVPIVATRVPGLEGYLIDGTTAIGVPPRDAKALAEAIDRLLANPTERTNLAKKAYEFSRRFSRISYISAIVDFIVAGRATQIADARPEV
jgi:glycosyltransferase involved in cell wall biosynthesis